MTPESYFTASGKHARASNIVTLSISDKTPTGAKERMWFFFFHAPNKALPLWDLTQPLSPWYRVVV